MPFESYQSRSPTFIPSESSRLSSHLARNSPGQSWKTSREQARRGYKDGSVLSQARTMLNRIPGQTQVLGGFHPFKIYRFPESLRRFQNADDWRRVKVRNGALNLSGTLTILGTNYGTDGCGESGLGGRDGNDWFDDAVTSSQTPPSTSASVVIGQWNEAIIPNDGNVYDIWLSFLDGLADPNVLFASTLMYGNNSSFNVDGSGRLKQGTSLYSGNTFSPVSYMGITDPYNLKIGSATVSNGQLLLYQEVFGNPIPVFNPLVSQSSGPNVSFAPRFRGPYSAIYNYYVGDVVTYDKQTHADGGLGTPNHYGMRFQYLYWPSSSTSTWSPQNSSGANYLLPMSGIDPYTHTPDPWYMLSESPIRLDNGGIADWVQGGYSATAWYWRAGT